MRWMLVVCMVFWAGASPAQQPGPGRLTVTGEGRIDSIPDMATITLGVTAEARKAAEALDQTSKSTGEVLTLLSESGIEARDVQTSDLSLSPLWNNSSSSSADRPEIVGYRASNTVTVRVRALLDLGAILDDVVESGANRFDGLSFGLQNPGPVQDAARRAAVAEALRKAALYADSAGLTLGPVLELRESGAVAPQPLMMERMVISEPLPVMQGEVSTNASVTMVFAISTP